VPALPPGKVPASSSSAAPSVVAGSQLLVSKATAPKRQLPRPKARPVQEALPDAAAGDDAMALSLPASDPLLIASSASQGEAELRRVNSDLLQELAANSELLQQQRRANSDSERELAASQLAQEQVRRDNRDLLKELAAAKAQSSAANCFSEQRREQTELKEQSLKQELQQLREQSEKQASTARSQLHDLNQELEEAVDQQAAAEKRSQEELAAAVAQHAAEAKLAQKQHAAEAKLAQEDLHATQEELVQANMNGASLRKALEDVKSNLAHRAKALNEATDVFQEQQKAAMDQFRQELLKGLEGEGRQELEDEKKAEKVIEVDAPKGKPDAGCGKDERSEKGKSHQKERNLCGTNPRARSRSRDRRRKSSSRDRITSPGQSS
ncbi:unnamed protein product, partial [Polarella glacialis]